MTRSSFSDSSLVRDKNHKGHYEFETLATHSVSHGPPPLEFEPRKGQRHKPFASLQELGQTGKRRSLLYNLNNLRPSRGSLVGEKVLYDPEKLEHPPPWLHRISLSPFYCKHWDLCVHQSHTNQQTTEKGQFELKMVDFRPISRKGRIDAYRVRLRLIGGKIEKNP